MTDDEAEELGRQAHREGRGNFPLAAPRIHAEVEHAQVGEKTNLLQAFNRGWQAENAAHDIRVQHPTDTPGGQDE
ncbi:MULTISPECIES: hypothetical protein [Mycolicibacter]|uniref:Antitoxin n=2 Tax=Mycolicibacter TaxID=1073531 RepID=A0ABU5XMB9_9MYCO|nr:MULTISPECIES: hypothetical protein [unclassified Mycolicibacter]MEB3023421.1 hypothetical protein [Mycolicibacter sp. MYC098]MEB3033763.1 hypothetical protein [Mycolicibacter sp. MYC340]